MDKVVDDIIIVKDLHKHYVSGNTILKVLKGLNFTVKYGEILGVVGESGSGKSTLLNLIGGLDSPTSGKIIVENEDIHSMSEEKLTIYRNRTVGFIFQFHYLLMDFTALENVMIPFLAYKYDKNLAMQKALKLLKDVGLEERVNHKPNQLSGGEQQRVAIARALINSPKIILADEPTGNLDMENSELVRKILWDLREKYNLTIIIVTHNQEIAEVTDRKIRLSYGFIKE